MSTREQRDRINAARCARKIDYPTWDEAEAACVQIARDGIGSDANPPTPYPCGDHYHVGHIRFGDPAKRRAAALRNYIETREEA